MSIRTHLFACKLKRKVADALNRESGRIYTTVMVEHWRLWRKKGVWLSPYAAQKLNDLYDAGTPSLLHSHSIDAAQEGFYKACKMARASRGKRTGRTRYPHRRKQYRTTIWKNTGIKKKGGRLRLALARGRVPVLVTLPAHLRALPEGAFKEARLVYEKAQQRYQWHLVVEDGAEPSEPPGDGVAAVDLGEIHPATMTDGGSAAVVTCRELRSVKQYTNKRLAELRSRQSSLQKHSRRWWRLQRRMNRFLAQQKNRVRDMEHKISRDVVNWCMEHEIGELAVGDVRDVADGKRLNRKSQQKVSNWSHGKVRCYIGYKAAGAGIVVIDDVDEAYTSQTCPACGERNKPRGRLYRCACGFTGHRDVNGAANILSRHLYGRLGNVQPPENVKYRVPHDVRRTRSPAGTGQVAYAP